MLLSGVMSDKTPVQAQIQTSLDTLAALRDEVRLQLHLAGMDAKQSWNDVLEPQIEEANKMAEDATAISQKAIEDIVHRIKAFRDQHVTKK